VDNNSIEIETKQYLKSLPYTVLNYNGNFNFSKINNFAVSKSSGEYLLFLNDDVEVLEPNWLDEMLGICQQKDVGAVGAKLLTRRNKIQHAGMVFLKNGFFFHPFDGEPYNSTEQFDFINLIRECSSVTGACFLTKRKTFDEVSGFDGQFDVFYGDSDLCFKIRELGLKIIYNPNAILRHDGSTKIKQVVRLFIPVENHHNFINKWKTVKYGDPFYNPNLGWNYSIDIEEVM
jgi:GT2 family glycosyltransferase